MTIWSSRSDSGRVLCAAASSGSRGTFEAVLGSLELELPPDEVHASSTKDRCQVLGVGCPQHSLLFMPTAKLLVSVRSFAIFNKA